MVEGVGGNIAPARNQLRSLPGDLTLLRIRASRPILNLRIGELSTFDRILHW